MYFGVKDWRKSNMIWDALYNKECTQFMYNEECKLFLHNKECAQFM